MSVRYCNSTIIFNSLYDINHKSRIIVGIVRHPCNKNNQFEVTVRLQCEKSSIDFRATEWKDLMRWGINDIQKYFGATLDENTLKATWHGDSYTMKFGRNPANRRLLFERSTRDCCDHEKFQRWQLIKKPEDIEEEELFQVCEEIEKTQEPIQVCEEMFSKFEMLKKCIKNKIRQCESKVDTIKIFEKVLVKKIKKVAVEIFNTNKISYDKCVVKEVIEHFTKEDKVSMLRLINRACVNSKLEKIDNNGFSMFFHEILTFYTSSVVSALNKTTTL